MANKRQQKKQGSANVRIIKGKSNNSHIEKSIYQDASDRHENELSGTDGIVKQPYPIKELQNLVEMSTILQQCVEAYKRNIVGFGATPKYVDDDLVADETPEMKREWEVIKEFIRYFSFEMSFEDVFGEIIGDREITGNGYLEVIRDNTNMPVEGDRIDPATIHVTKLFSERVEVPYIRDGKKFNRKRQFRKFVQEIGTKKVFFKEFGDPRKMDSRTGKYGEDIEEEYQATEVLHFKIGSATYGVPRWIGQLIHMYGARKAEELNFRYFTQGRHTPMAIMLHNAILSPESEQALEEYANAVEGVENSHKFLLIEAEGMTEGILDDEKTKGAKVELKSLAEMLQQDALFLEYDNASREKVQSSFRLPDIYVGRSKDFNRATADTARYITEEQVFEPERKSIEWIINNKLLTDYFLDDALVVFNKPEISDIEQVVKILDVANKIEAVAPNDIRDILGNYLGKELEEFEGENFDIPAAVARMMSQAETTRVNAEHQASLMAQIETQAQNIQKSLTQDDLLNLMKDIRDVLEAQVEAESDVS